jgi:hypothetical protein
MDSLIWITLVIWHRVLSLEQNWFSADTNKCDMQSLTLPHAFGKQNIKLCVCLTDLAFLLVFNAFTANTKQHFVWSQKVLITYVSVSNSYLDLQLPIKTLINASQDPIYLQLRKVSQGMNVKYIVTARMHIYWMMSLLYYNYIPKFGNLAIQSYWIISLPCQHYDFCLTMAAL